jgi:hypothetical protein
MTENDIVLIIVGVLGLLGFITFVLGPVIMIRLDNKGRRRRGEDDVGK